MKPFKIFLAMVLVIVLSSSDAHSKQAKGMHRTYNIGVFLPITGPLKSLGEKQREGITLANILRPYADGHKIRLIFKDTRCDPRHTSEIVFKLIKDYRPLCLIGGVTSDDALPAIKLATKFKVPVVITTATSPLIMGDSDYTWRVCPSDSLRAKVCANLVMHKTDNGKVALIVDQYRYSSIMLASALASKIIKYGGSIVTVSFIKTGQKDFIPLMASILAGGSEAVFLAAPAKESALIINGARKRGINIPFFLADIFQESILLSHLNKNVSNVYVITDYRQGDTHSQIGKKFSMLFKKQVGGYRFDSSVALAADAYLMATDAINIMLAGKTKDIKAAFSMITGDKYICSNIVMKPTGDPVRPLFVSIIKNKRLNYVESVYIDTYK